MSFILGRPDQLKPAVDVFLEETLKNFDRFAAQFPSACAFAAKVIEILSGHVCQFFINHQVAFEDFVLKFANILIDLQFSQTVDALFCKVIYSIQVFIIYHLTAGRDFHYRKRRCKNQIYIQSISTCNVHPQL